MTLAELLVGENDIKLRHRLPRTTDIYNSHVQSMSNYISWMKEQINKSKCGYIRIRREDLARSIQKELMIVGYPSKNFKNLYKMIRVVLFNEGLFVNLSCYGGEHIFIIRNRTENDYLIPSLLQLEKKIKETKHDQQSAV